MSKKIFVAKAKQDLERCFEVMKELRPHLSYEDYLEIYQDAHNSDHYEIVAIEEHGQILALMGYRILSDFVRGRHLYIDDLVTAEFARSRGLGAELLKHAEGLAKDLNCKSLRLCTGTENVRGIQFYERNGWTRRSFAYVKKLS